MTDAAPTRRIAALFYDGALALDAIGPLEAFAFAATQVVEDFGRPRIYEVSIIAETPGVAQSSSGVRLYADYGYRDGARAPENIDTLIVPGMRAGGEDMMPEHLVRWVAGCAGRVRRIASVCSGAFILADAGLLDGRRATTHWLDSAALQARRPAARVENDRIWTRDGPVWTSGGVTAGIDLALALIEADHGRALALKVARRMVMFLKRPGDQAQFSDVLAAQARSERLAPLIEWIEGALDHPFTVECLADRCAMSPRNFARRFHAEIGVSPLKYVERRRIERARRLLEETHAPLSTIARTCGFGSDERLRRAFQRALGVTPTDYRARFGPSEPD